MIKENLSLSEASWFIKNRKIKILSALWEAEAGGSRSQEFKTSLTNMVKPHLY